MSRWYENSYSNYLESTNISRIPSFAELIRSFDSSDKCPISKTNSPHFEAHYKVRILPKESSPAPVLKSDSLEVRGLSSYLINSNPKNSSLLPVSPSSEVKQLIQNYISETKKLITEFARFEDDFKDGSFPRTIPEDSIDELANVHQNASKTLLDIRKSYRDNQNGPKISTENKKKSKVSKCAKPRSNSSNRKVDHSIVAFTIKGAKPQTSMIAALSPTQDYLNKELCLKSSTVCTQCGSTQTPEWRSGPSGSRTLCNACGLFYSKLVKKMGVASACDCLKKRKRAGGI